MAISLSKKICDILIKKKIVTEEALNKARAQCAEKGGSLSDILVKMNAVPKEELLTAISDEAGFPPVNLSNFNIEDDVIALIPKKFAVSYKIIPVSRMGTQLTVAMVDPLNIFAIDDLKLLTHLEISPVIASEDDMEESLRKYYERSAHEEISSIVEDIESAEMEMVPEGEDMSSTELFRITQETPVVKLANMILGKAVKVGASDILIEPMEDASRVRYRIDGTLREFYSPQKKYHQAIISRIKVMSSLDIAERRLPQDGRFSVKVEDRKVDFRISIVPSSLGEKAALRVLDQQQATIDIERLGFNKRDVKIIKEAGSCPHGMILICGPTGCGKTTTLYSLLKDIDDPTKNIVTVEDPVEYELKGINQVSINAEIGLTFAGCLRSILRQDPDVIMVGEIRDFETLDVAIKSALTGHVVLSTLHTNTAGGAIVRMVNMGIEPFLISASVELIAAQRLLRLLCPECKEPYKPSRQTAEKYGLLKNEEIINIYKPVGCDRCMNSGYKGRVGIIESLRLTPAIKDLIFRGAREFEIEQKAREEGMTMLRENGIEHVIAGEASLEDVLCSTVESKKTGSAEK
ncbi:MAG: ATPase, T2SS/T4P/T4SS family [Candidatus Omnitrophota bacterium]